MPSDSLPSDTGPCWPGLIGGSVGLIAMIALDIAAAWLTVISIPSGIGVVLVMTTLDAAAVWPTLQMVSLLNQSTFRSCEDLELHLNPFEGMR